MPTSTSTNCWSICIHIGTTRTISMCMRSPGMGKSRIRIRTLICRYATPTRTFPTFIIGTHTEDSFVRSSR